QCDRPLGEAVGASHRHARLDGHAAERRLMADLGDVVDKRPELRLPGQLLVELLEARALLVYGQEDVREDLHAAAIAGQVAAFFGDLGPEVLQLLAVGTVDEDVKNHDDRHERKPKDPLSPGAPLGMVLEGFHGQCPPSAGETVATVEGGEAGVVDRPVRSIANVIAKSRMTCAFSTRSCEYANSTWENSGLAVSRARKSPTSTSVGATPCSFSLSLRSGFSCAARAAREVPAALVASSVSM